MANTAFENISLRAAWHAKTAVDKYTAMQIAADGTYEKATGTGQFVGIVQYGTEIAGDMITVVKGAFPVIATVDLVVGDKVTIDAAAAGKFKKAATGNTVYGTVLTPGAAGTLVTIQTADVTLTV